MHKVSDQLAVAFLLVGVVCLPQVVTAASVTITEVMYSPAGPDSGHEWVEVHNQSGQSITLTDWSLRENETDHWITTDNSQTLKADERAIIADDPQKFTSTYTTSGLVFDSTFSLNNDGEQIAIVNANDVVVNTLTYDSETGADGDGNSLQLVDSRWVAAEPTPNAVNKEGSVNTNEGEVDTESDQSGIPDKILEPRADDPQEDDNESQDEPTSVTVNAGDNQQAIAGVQLHLQGTTTVPEGVSSNDADIYWSLGNGDTKDSANIFYTYQHPGDYVATLIYRSEDRHKTDQITVEVLPPDLHITDRKVGSDGYVKIDNQLNRDVNLSGWHLRSGDKANMLPDYTIALANSTLTLNNEATGMLAPFVQLLYPDGTVADTYRPNHSATTSTTTSNLSTSISRSTSRVATASKQSTNTATTTEETTASSQQALSDLFATTSQSAAAGTAGAAGAGFWQWALMTLMLVVGSIGVAVFVRNQTQQDQKHRLDDVFDITEM